MPPRSPRSKQLEALRGLADSPEEQTALAVTIVEAGKDALALRAALDVLRQRPTLAARPALLKRYAYLAADGVRRDAGTYLRAAILQALRHVLGPEDRALLEQAVVTFEFLPPTRSEEAHLLRSAALVALNQLDGEAASYHAVRLLADRHTSAHSGEPALTAARVLAAQENRWPLYFYALNYERLVPAEHPASEVLAECFKSLAGLPEALVSGLVEKYRATRDDVVLVGLLDLVLECPNAGFAAEFVQHGLRLADRLDVYRYLVTRLVNSHHPPWLAQLSEAAQRETDRSKLGVLAEALALGRGEPALQAALATVKARLARQL